MIYREGGETLSIRLIEDHALAFAPNPFIGCAVISS
jgi:hypothetical protein